MPGHGQSRWPEIFKILKDVGFRGTVSVELEDADGKSVDEIYDLLAVRILVETVTDCYTALGVVHGLLLDLQAHQSHQDFLALLLAAVDNAAPN